MGEDSCFSLAFGLPAVLMFIAICKFGIFSANIIQNFAVFFWFGRNSYKRQTPDKNIVTLFFKASWVRHSLLTNNTQSK